MGGTVATFAGLVCTDVRFARSRGHDSDLSTVEIPVENFPGGLQLVPAVPGQVGGEIKVSIPEVGLARIAAQRKFGDPLPALKQSALVFAGTLCMAEAQDETWKVIVHPLYVQRVERVRASRKGGAARLRVTLVDQRHFPRGHLFRWSYNRVRADLQVAPGSVKPDGKPFTLAEIADQVVASMLRRPKLTNTPATWSQRSPAIELPPLGSPVVGMAELERVGGAEPPCLRLDGSFAFHRLGEGRVGWAKDGVGANVQDFPEPLRLWKQGAGEGHSIELSYPDDWVIVRGLERVQTIALDNCEPVLVVRVSSPNPDRALGADFGAVVGAKNEHAARDLGAEARALRDRANELKALGNAIDPVSGEPADAALAFVEKKAAEAEKAERENGQGGIRLRSADVEPVDDFELGAPRVLPLNEEVVHALTDGKLSIGKLRQWVLQPRVYQDSVGLEERIARVLRDQAWRLWRIPGVVVNDAVAGRNDVLNPTTKPGPNANLLPLLPCAETVAGRREPIVVQTFRHRARHQILVGKGEVSLRGTRARTRMAEILTEADTIADLKQLQPVREGGSAQISDSGFLTDEQLGSAQAIAAGATLEGFRRAIEQTRLIDRLRAVDGALATEYEAELKKAAEANDKLSGGGETALLDLAKKAVAFENSIREAADEIAIESGFDWFDAQDTELLQGLSASDFLAGKTGTLSTATTHDVELARARAAAFGRSIQSDLRALERARDERKRQGETGVSREDAIPPEYGPIFVRNLPRTRDHSAHLYSAELGIFATSTLPGWINPEGSPEPASSLFISMPVRVCFGAVVRPTPSAATGRVTSAVRVNPDNRLGDLADEVTWFTRCFKRGDARGLAALPVALRDVPAGEGTVVPLNEHELIPLAGSGNTARLEELALELAQERFRPKPKLEEKTYVVARPWPVNCDGVVRGMAITMRPGGKGFETTISVGSGTWDRNPARTRLRPAPLRAEQIADGRNREGTRPRA